MKQYLILLFSLITLPAFADVPRVSAQQFVDLQQGESTYPGYRRAHAKGMCISGEFVSNGNLSRYSTASVFKSSKTPFIGRLSIAGNNPYAPDLKAPVRSLALSFATSQTKQWRVAMNTPPVMAVANPHDFYQQIVAIKKGPEAIGAFFEAHPESADFLQWKANYQPSSSFALETYHSINAFYLVDEQNQRQAVRWEVKPHASTSSLKNSFTGDNALFNEFKQQLSDGPVMFDWVFTLATEQDDEHNPAKRWPQTREKMIAGQIKITQWQAQQGGRCDGINYDPLVLPQGIEATKDPILRARSAAYAESYRRRAVEVLAGDVEEGRDE
ncbi:catalase family peroxidase [Pseudoalteromonas sp. T1lg48]|uniref:catalase family peroxidase n=1 Tax=Pseudoalteromonas sp. T1lg48 TaxID=2077100 RepID=UPI000CF6FDBC|nr:catalase family peroxidase [Pseudoalteromonas sp. T1lg48]